MACSRGGSGGGGILSAAGGDEMGGVMRSSQEPFAGAVRVAVQTASGVEWRWVSQAGGSAGGSSAGSPERVGIPPQPSADDGRPVASAGNLGFPPAASDERGVMTDETRQATVQQINALLDHARDGLKSGRYHATRAALAVALDKVRLIVDAEKAGKGER